MTAGLVVDIHNGDQATCRRHGLFRTMLHRLGDRSGPPGGADVGWPGRAEEAYAVLSAARPLLECGWVQNRWYAKMPQTDTNRHRSAGEPPAGATVFGACLVGAVVRAAPRQDPVAAGPALDFLWDAWQETRGLGGPGVAGRSAPPEVRTARVRDLTRWNDQP